MRIFLCHLREGFLRDLAEGRDGQVLDHQHALGQLEFRDLLLLQEIDQLGELELRPLFQDQAGAHLLAEVRVGHRHAGHVLHRRVREDEVLDLLGADLLPAAVDEVLLAPLDHVVARRMAAHQVAGAVEAVRRELLRVVFRHAVVAAQRVRPAAGELADLSRRDLAAFIVDEAHLVVGADGAAAGLERHVLRVVEAHEEEHALRHAEVLLHERAREELPGAQAHFRLHALPAALDDLQRREVVLRDRRVVDQPDEKGRDDLDMGCSMPFHQLEDLFRARAGRQDHLAALKEVALDAGAGQRQVVRDRQREQEHRVARDAAHRRGGLRVVRVVVVRARDELRNTGRPARELEDAGIGRIDFYRFQAFERKPRRLFNELFQLWKGDAKSQRRIADFYPLDHGLEIEVALALGIDAGARAGKLDELVDLGEAVRDERGDRDAGDLLQREVEQHELGAVRQRGHDAVEGLQAELEQVQRQVVGEAVDLRIGVLPLAVDQRDAIPVFLEDGGKFLGQALVLPVALLAVALRELRRKRNDARQHQVEAVKPPSMTRISPVTKRFAWTRLIMLSATSSAVTTRLSGVALARLPIRSSYLSFSMRFIQSPSIQPGATALTRISGPRFQASVLVRFTTAALLAA